MKNNFRSQHYSPKLLVKALLAVITLTYSPKVSLAGEAVSAPSVPLDTRYGPFNLLDHRSAYGQGVYPEPFLVDDTDLERNEFRLDWLNTSGPAQQNSGLKAEIEKGFGLVTFELESVVSRNNLNGQTSAGLENTSLGARCPFYQYVSQSGFVNTTFGAALEVGVPIYSSLSQNTEIVPKVFNDLSLGKHFTLQSIAGYSTLLGGGNDGGLQSLEYGFVFGYTIQHEELPLPLVRQLIPMLELKGDTGLNKDALGQSNLIGDAGFRLNLKAIGAVQPRLGCAFVFPMNQGARQDLNCGFIVSMVFDY